MEIESIPLHLFSHHLCINCQSVFMLCEQLISWEEGRREGSERKTESTTRPTPFNLEPPILNGTYRVVSILVCANKLCAECKNKKLYEYVKSCILVENWNYTVFVTQVEPFLMWVNTTPTNSTQIKDLYRGFCVELLEGLKKNQQQFLPFGEHFPILTMM